MSTPMTPPPLGAAPGWASAAPTGLMWATIGLSGAATLVLVASGLTQASTTYAEYAARSLTQLNPTDLISGLFFPLAIGAYITLSLWAQRVHQNLTAAGVEQSLSGVWVWFAWFIPLANYVLPAIYFHGLNKRSKSWALWPWWIAWCAYWSSGFLTIPAQIEIQLNVPANAETFGDIMSADQYQSLLDAGYVSLGAGILSFVFLSLMLKRINDTHLNEA